MINYISKSHPLLRDVQAQKNRLFEDNNRLQVFNNILFFSLKYY
jgi:hypothetical protein